MFEKSIIKALDKILDEVMEEIARQFTSQGHTLTGSLNSSLEKDITIKGLGVVGTISMLDYGLYVNNGVSAVRIPYSGNGGGGKSKYIQGLIRFFILRGLPAKEAKSAAFATARKHKKEGMPTKASARFSKTRKRKGVLDDAIKNKESLIFDSLSSTVSESVELSIFNAFRKTKTKP